MNRTGWNGWHNTYTGWQPDQWRDRGCIVIQDGKEVNALYKPDQDAFIINGQSYDRLEFEWYWLVEWKPAIPRGKYYEIIGVDEQGRETTRVGFIEDGADMQDQLSMYVQGGEVKSFREIDTDTAKRMESEKAIAHKP